MKISQFLIIATFLLGSVYTGYAQCEDFGNFPHGEQEGRRNYWEYRQLMKKGKIAEAIPRWRTSMQYTPGGSELNFVDGVKIYEYLIDQESDKAKITAYRDSMFVLFDKRIECKVKTDKKKGSVLTRKAYTMYKHEAELNKVFATYQEGFKLAGAKVNSYVIYPYAYAAVEQFKNGVIDNKEAQRIHKHLIKVIEHNIENTDKEGKKFKFGEVKEKVNKVFHQKLDSPIFDCEYYSNIYLPEYQNHPDSPAIYRMVYRELVKSGCDKNTAILQEIYIKDSIYRAEQTSLVLAARRDAAPKTTKAVWAYQDENFELAAELFVAGAAEEELDTESRANMCYKAAQIAFANLKDFPKARMYAEKAIGYNPNWGKPYLLIGDLYASSGAKCGSGRGFNSQRVTWIAIDMWKKAASVDKDPDVQKKAKAQINKYHKFMPTTEDIHFRKLKEGQSYKIPCWIQRTTTVRSYNEYDNP